MAELHKEPRSEQPKCTPRRQKVSVPVKAVVGAEGRVKDFPGRMEELTEGKARISLDHPLTEGTELSVLVEFSDSKGREIRFRYKGKVASVFNGPLYEVDVDFEQGVGISGAGAREMLAELFPKDD